MPHASRGEQKGPGTCPKCGMALEARAISLDTGEGDPEYDYKRNRFVSAAILTLPLAIIAMSLSSVSVVGNALSLRAFNVKGMNA